MDKLVEIGQAGDPSSQTIADIDVRNTGNLLILGMLGFAIVLAAAGWWFRYATTNRAIEFWGAAQAERIRDAPVVRLCEVDGDPAVLSEVRDISDAPGLVHLRNALLEDDSFVWLVQVEDRQPKWRWAIGFGAGPDEEMLFIRFTADFQQMMNGASGEVVSSAPIAAGLSEMLARYSEVAPIGTH